MSPTPWTNWAQNCSYNRGGKRRFDEINTTIDCLKTELLMNDIVLKNEIDLRINSDYDRALMSAELYKERLEALATSSRSQIWRVQTGNSPVQAHDFHLDYDSWNPKRTKYSYAEGYSQNSNIHYQDWAFNTIQKPNNTQPIQRAVPRKPTTTKTRASVASLKRTATTLKPLHKSRTTLKTIAMKSVSGETIAPVKSNSVPMVKNIVSTKTSYPVVVTNTATEETKESKLNNPVANSKIGNTLPIKYNPTTQVGVAAVKTQASVTATKGVTTSTTLTAYENASSSVKTEPNIDKNELTQNIPSLLSCDLSHIKLEFDEGGNIFGKYKNNWMEPSKNSTVKIKAQPATDEDAMVDDLADSL